MPEGGDTAAPTRMHGATVVYDGFGCNACDTYVNGLNTLDTGNRLRFAAHQWGAGANIVRSAGGEPEQVRKLYTLVHPESGEGEPVLYTGGQAVLAAVATADPDGPLGNLARRLLRRVPQPVLDVPVSLVSRFRHLLGTKKECPSDAPPRWFSKILPDD
jgi:predicted DCC family thiol-disulfide oxidoreductase YuxK